MFWKIYFWVITILLVVVNLSTSGWTAVDYLGDVALLVSLVAMFGYAHNKKILNRNVWKFLAPIAVVVWYLYQLYFDRLYGGHPSASNEDLIFEVIIALPIFVATLLYAHKPKIKF